MRITLIKYIFFRIEVNKKLILKASQYRWSKKLGYIPATKRVYIHLGRY